jgi:hypothetical protein
LSSTITDQLQGGQGGDEEGAGDYAEESTIVRSMKPTNSKVTEQDLSHFNTPVEEEHSGEISMVAP